MNNTTISPGDGYAAVTGTPVAKVLAGILAATWSGLAESASGAPIAAQGIVKQAKFTASGTFGAGGVVAIEGSPDGINWTQLGLIESASAPADAPASGAGFQASAPNLVPTGTAEINGVNGVTVPSVPAPVDATLIVAVTDPSAGPPTKFFQPIVQGGDGTTALSVTGQLSAAGAI